ncbi:hypothetical protein C8R44DRAFT_800198 [Mycena epipterygia]|nr:hypothetical protein C8R44DRAFT_800198 [Mycena epipterygia]
MSIFKTQGSSVLGTSHRVVHGRFCRRLLRRRCAGRSSTCGPWRSSSGSSGNIGETMRPRYFDSPRTMCCCRRRASRSSNLSGRAAVPAEHPPAAAGVFRRGRAEREGHGHVDEDIRRVPEVCRERRRVSHPIHHAQGQVELRERGVAEQGDWERPKVGGVCACGGGETHGEPDPSQAGMGHGADRCAVGLDRLNSPPGSRVHQRVPVACAVGVHGPCREGALQCGGLIVLEQTLRAVSGPCGALDLNCVHITHYTVLDLG